MAKHKSGQTDDAGGYAPGTDSRVRHVGRQAGEADGYDAADADRVSERGDIRLMTAQKLVDYFRRSAVTFPKMISLHANSIFLSRFSGEQRWQRRE